MSGQGSFCLELQAGAAANHGTTVLQGESNSSSKDDDSTFPPADVFMDLALSVSPGFGNLSTCSIMSALTDPTTTRAFLLASAITVVALVRRRCCWRRVCSRKAEQR